MKSPMTAPVKAISLLALTALLASCGTTFTAEQRAARDNERCLARGLKPDTDAFADCLVAMDTERATRMQRGHQANIERTTIPPLMR